MTTGFVADTGVFVRCGGPGSEKLARLRRSVRAADVVLRVPLRVYEELGGDPAADAYPSGAVPDCLHEDWIEVADELEHSNPLVSTVMDQARRFIANETGRDEDGIEKADTALLGLAAQMLDIGETDTVVLLTTDKPAGRAAEALLPRHGFERQVEFRYVSEEFLETVTPADFRRE